MFWCDGESGARLGGARKNSLGDDIFDGFLDEATHGASAHFGVVAAFDKDLFGLGSDFDGNFLESEVFIGGGDNKIKNANKVILGKRFKEADFVETV